jgi:hypothetical protein
VPFGVACVGDTTVLRGTSRDSSTRRWTGQVTSRCSSRAARLVNPSASRNPLRPFQHRVLEGDVLAHLEAQLGRQLVLRLWEQFLPHLV